MTDYDPNDLSGTDNLVDPGDQSAKVDKPTKPKKATKKKASTKPAAKRGTPLPQPSQTIEEAIAARVPTKKLDALLKEWGKYNLQQATIKAKADTDLLVASIKDRRRRIADELLKIADGYGISMAEAKNILAEALDAERSGKLK